MEFFSHIQATCNDQFKNQTSHGPMLVTEYAVWSKKNLFWSILHVQSAQKK